MVAADQPFDQTHGTLIVTSARRGRGILAMCHRRKPLQASHRQGHTRYSGLWVFKDDHTDVRHPRRPLQNPAGTVQPQFVHAEVILEDSNNR